MKPFIQNVLCVLHKCRTLRGRRRERGKNFLHTRERGKDESFEREGGGVVLGDIHKFILGKFAAVSTPSYV